MNHYFTDNKNLKSAETKTEYIFGSERFVFITDAGVFARDGVDGATDVLLRCLPKITAGARVLDIGCGYGAAGVVLSRIYGAGIEVVMSDVSERALGLARRNLTLNGAEAEVAHSDGFENLTGNFDYIIFNPPIHAGKSVIYNIYETSRGYLKPGGALYVVARRKHGAESHKKKLEEIYGAENCAVVYSKKGIFVYNLRKG